MVEWKEPSADDGVQLEDDRNDHRDHGQQSIVPDSGRANKETRGTPSARGILNFGQLSPHTRT